MDEKELKKNAEIYCELLIVYYNMIKALEGVTKKITATKKEIMFLEKLLIDNGVKIKDVDEESVNVEQK